MTLIPFILYRHQLLESRISPPGRGVGDNRTMPNLYLQCTCGAPIDKNRWRKGKRKCLDCALVGAAQWNAAMQDRKSGARALWKERMNAMLDRES